MGKCVKTVNPDYWVEGYEEYIASISYGKDSLAMLEVIHAFGYPLTQIVTVDVMTTETMSAYHKEVDEFRKYADEVILKRYGIPVTHLRSKYTYDGEFHRVRIHNKLSKPENVGKIYGFPMIRGAWCNRDLKMNPINAYKEKNQFWYIGYAIDEKQPKRQDRIKNCYDLRMFPLCNHNMRERDAIRICQNIGLLSPTYTSSLRDGCWFCHNQSLEQLRLLRKNHPEKWKMMLKWDTESPVKFRQNASVHDLDLRFQLEERYLSQGKSITNRKFYQDLKKFIERNSDNEKSKV